MAVFNGTAGNDSLVGAATDDVLNGLAGNDTLDGGLGADVLQGGAGDDSYIVDNVGDVVNEVAGEGTDTVQSSISFTLGTEVENLNGAGTTGLTLTGNTLLNIINGTTGSDVLEGGNDALVDTLAGGLGNDTYIIRNTVAVTAAETDVITEVANAGNDTALVVASAQRTAYALDAGVSIENVVASDVSSTLRLDLTGNDLAQNIAGNNGVNILTGGGGADTLTGFGGNDTYVVSTNTTVVNEADLGGNDTVNIVQDFAAAGAAVTYTLTGAVETINIATTGAGAATQGINVIGGVTSQAINGNAAANLLNGGGGADTLTGGLGDDTYIVDSLDDVVVEATGAGTGTDTVSVTGSYQLNAANIEVLAATGLALPSAANAGTPQGDGTLDLGGLNTTTNAGGATTFLTGDTLTSQAIYGNAGNNILNGRQGTGAGGVVDTLIGGSGDDIYRVYDQADVVIEDTAGGNDTIYTSANYSLATNSTNAAGVTIGNTNGAAFVTGTAMQIENLIVADGTSTTAINLTGNGFGQIIVGNYGANVITSGGVGAGQIDQLSGLRGNDVYNVSSRQTTVNENAGEGTDTVNVDLTGTNDTFFSLIPQAEVEFLNATGAGRIDLQGSSFAQVITGNGASNSINGFGGADTMVGGAAGDNYVVTDQSQQVVEANGVEVIGGVTQVDTVFTSVSYDLANSVSYIATAGDAAIATTPTTPGQAAVLTTGQVGIEVLTTSVQAGTEALNLTGNGQAQTIIGNFGNNILNGDNDTVTVIGGANVQSGTVAGDTLTGLFGDDTYRVYSQADVVREQAGQGTDTVVFGLNTATNASALDASNTYQLRADNSVELLTVANQSRAVGYQLIGNGFDQTVLGSRANDVIWGGAGHDTLTGNGGNDTFGFNEAGAADSDTISDYTGGDIIGLSAAVGTGFFQGLATTSGGQTAGFDQNEFVNGTTATEAHAQILYNQASGQIFYDADGTGASAAVLVATIGAGTQLANNDFTVLTTAPTTIAGA